MIKTYMTATMTMKNKARKALTFAVALAMLLTLISLVSAEGHSLFGEPVDSPYDLSEFTTEKGYTPTLYDGNFNDDIPEYYHYKEDYGMNGFELDEGDNPQRFDFYPDPEDASVRFSVWLDEDMDGKVFIYRWEAENMDVHYIITKGGDYFFVFDYHGEETYDQYLKTPRVGVDDQNLSDLSHFNLYWTPMITPDETEPTEPTEPTADPDLFDIDDENLPLAEETTTTTEEETTATAETTADPDLFDIDDDDLPLAEETTTETEEETTAATVTTTTTTQTTTQEQEVLVLVDEEIPQTGQTANNVIVGLILITLAGGLSYLIYRSKNRGRNF